MAAPNLCWNDIAIVDELGERIGAPLPLDADNEANLAALAELWEGVAIGASDFMYASGQIGVGGGIVLRGELFRGYRGFGGRAGAHGHRRRRGALRLREPRLPGDALRPGTVARSRPAARRWAGARHPVADLARRARARDPVALAALHECGAWLGIALGNVANLLSPQAVVLGGYFAPIATWLAPGHRTASWPRRVLGGVR